MYSTLISDKSFLRAFLASAVDLKTGPTFIPNHVIEMTMEDLLTQYFTSHSSHSQSSTWSIHLCIGQMPHQLYEETPIVKKSVQPTQKQNQSKKVKKEPVTIKIYIYITYCHEYFCKVNIVLDRDKNNTQALSF